MLFAKETEMLRPRRDICIQCNTGNDEIDHHRLSEGIFKPLNVSNRGLFLLNDMSQMAVVESSTGHCDGVKPWK